MSTEADWRHAGFRVWASAQRAAATSGLSIALMYGRVTGVTRPRSLGYSGRTGSNPADSRTTFESLNSWIRSAVDPTTWIEFSLSAMKKSAPSHRAGSMNVPTSGPPG
jgi:hypothetical protein